MSTPYTATSRSSEALATAGKGKDRRGEAEVESKERKEGAAAMVQASIVTRQPAAWAELPRPAG